MMKIFSRLCIVVIGCLLIFAYFFLKESPVNTCQIVTKEASFPLQLEIADTLQKRTLGLMFRKTLPANNGMLFLFDTLQKGSMWMKNTYIPLDMMFFNKQFEIVHIHENAVPQDETIITTPMPVWGVIEVNAGYVRQNNIQSGDKIICPPQKDNP